MTATNTHLDKHIAANLGSFYTPKVLVAKAYALMQRHISHLNQYTFWILLADMGTFSRKQKKTMWSKIANLSKM